MEELIEDYERKVKSINQLLGDKNNDYETTKRLKIKLGCYRSFLVDLNRVLK